MAVFYSTLLRHLPTEWWQGKQHEATLSPAQTKETREGLDQARHPSTEHQMGEQEDVGSPPEQMKESFLAETRQDDGGGGGDR